MVFDRYAALVKTLRVESGTIIPMRHFTQEPLLPHLRNLTWDLGDDASDIFPLLESPIEKFIIDGCDFAQELAFEALLYRLPSLPNLHSLTLRGELDIPPVPNMLHHLHHLQSFCYNAARIPEDLLLRLSSLSTLRTLDIRGMPKISPDDSEVRSFPALETLIIFVDNEFDGVPILLSQITSGRLRNFRVEFHNGELPDAMDLMVTLTASHSRSLRRCIIGGDCKPEPRLDASLLAPFYSCNFLERFSFNIRGIPTKLLDVDLEMMAMSWPQIKVLQIFQSQSDHDPTPTLHGLNALANRCAGLIEVMINVDGTIPPISPNLSSSSLRRLHLMHSPCGSVEGGVTFINHAFPHLCDLDAWEGGWKEVRGRLPHMPVKQYKIGEIDESENSDGFD